MRTLSLGGGQGLPVPVENDQSTMSDVAVAPERTTQSPSRGSVAGRPLRRPASLPSGRAVVGGFLVALAAVGIFAAYSRATAGPTASYVVARHDLPLGSRLTASDLTLLPMELPGVVASNAAFTTEASLVGATVVGPIRRGELVQAGDVVKKRSAAVDLEISFPIESARALNGTLRPGERVDVLATFGAGGETYTVLVVRQARVLEAVSAGATLGDGGGQTITLAIATSEEALALSHAVNAGDVTLVRATGSDASGQVGQTYHAPSSADDRSTRTATGTG